MCVSLPRTPPYSLIPLSCQTPPLFRFLYSYFLHKKVVCLSVYLSIYLSFSCSCCFVFSVYVSLEGVLFKWRLFQAAMMSLTAGEKKQKKNQTFSYTCIGCSPFFERCVGLRCVFFLILDCSFFFLWLILFLLSLCIG